MGATVVADPAPVAKQLEEVLKYMQKNSGHIDSISAAATELQNYAKEEEDKKKKSAAKKISKKLSDQASALNKDYSAQTKKIQTTIREIQRI